VQNTWRRAGATYGVVGQLILLTLVAGLLVAGITLPAIAITGIAARDASNTFDNLPVGSLGTPPTVSKMYDAEGQVIAEFYPGDIYRVPVTYNQIAPVMRQAIVAIEDDNFWTEGALDPRGTLRAIFSDEGGGQLQGASTLAQQYVKNVRVLQAGDNNTLVQQAIYPDAARKLEQLRIASTVEHEMSQQNLLAAYLNVAPFGEHAYGIQVAAERYFSVPASQLTLTQAAELAGIVQEPSGYDPIYYPTQSLARRNEVLSRMYQLHEISKTEEQKAEASPIVLHMSTTPLNTGCVSAVSSTGYFCNYVQNVLQRDYPAIWQQMIKGTGGLGLYTTLDMPDQDAAHNAVTFVEPQYSGSYNPGHNADTEVLIQPGTGAVRAIAINRNFASQQVDYAVNSDYGGGAGVQTGSSSKIFTLITALDDGYPFGHQIKVVSPSVVGPYYNCHGDEAGGGTTPTGQYVPPGYFSVVNSEGDTGKGGDYYQLYSATVGSINVYFAHLEQQVGLCNVVKTAVDMGMTRADGGSLLKPDNGQLSADNYPSFTLGSVNVSPMSMATAYASVAADGMYCAPKVLTKIVTVTGTQLPLQPDSCHRDMSRAVATAANYILQGVLESGTAAGRTIGRPAAGKTGTANTGYYAAFAGWTPTLAGYVSVFNPLDPTTGGAMLGSNSCFRQVGLGATGELSCPGQMYGDDAPGATWEDTFLNAQLGPALSFPSVPGDSPFWAQGPGNVEKPVSTPKPPPGHHGPGGPGGPGGRPTPPPRV
jgi:membrane peptidoglycan carboxypeptidase